MRDDIRLDEPPGSGGSAWEKGRVVALFAIVHGSMAAPAAYRRLATELGRRGQRTVLVELPVDRPELTGTDYARLVAQQLDAALAQDGIQQEPVVVVAHSASGLLLPLVPSFHPVAHLVYLAAGVPQPGMTLDEQLQAEPDMLNPAWVDVDPFQSLVSRGPVWRTLPTGGVPAGPKHLHRVCRRPRHPAALVPAGRQRPAARPGDRAARRPLPPRVPPGAPGRGPDLGYRIPLRMARICAPSFGRSFCATDQTRSTSMSK
jgi:hypothetical protein